MTILDRYLIKRLFVTFFKTCVSLVSLFIIIDLLTHRRSSIIALDVPATIVVEYYLLYIPILLNTLQMAPLSLLIAGLLVFGTLVQRVEYTAMLASGIGLKRILLAPLIVSTLIGIGMLGLNETLGPYAAQRTHEIEFHYFGKIRVAENSQRSGVFWTHLDDGWKCDIRKFNREAMTGENVFLFAKRSDRHEKIQAKRIFWDEAQATWFLEDGTWTTYKIHENMTRETQRITQIPAPFSASPTYLFSAEMDTQSQSIRELSALMNEHQFQGFTERRMTLNLHGKIIAPLLCLLFMSLSIPFSIRLGRVNISTGLSIALLLGMSYLILAGITQSMGYSGQIPPIMAAWIPFIVYFFLSSALIYRTPT